MTHAIYRGSSRLVLGRRGETRCRQWDRASPWRRPGSIALRLTANASARPTSSSCSLRRSRSSRPEGADAAAGGAAQEASDSSLTACDASWTASSRCLRCSHWASSASNAVGAGDLDRWLADCGEAEDWLSVAGGGFARPRLGRRLGVTGLRCSSLTFGPSGLSMVAWPCAGKSE